MNLEYIKEAISQLTNELVDQRNIASDRLFRPEFKHRAKERIELIRKLLEDLCFEYELILCPDCLEAFEKSETKKGICIPCHDDARDRVEMTLFNFQRGK